MPYGPTHWCQPIVTMHHMNSEEISTFWDWEQRRGPGAPPVRMRDMYAAHVAPKLRARRDDWDNVSEDRYYVDRERQWDSYHQLRAKLGEPLSEVEAAAHRGPDECERACESLPGEECFQWRWRDGLCSVRGSFTLGWPVKRPENEAERLTSGWMIARIKQWIEAQGECGEMEWPAVEDPDATGQTG